MQITKLSNHQINTMTLNILTPELKVFSGEVDSVKLCGTDGQFDDFKHGFPGK